MAKRRNPNAPFWIEVDRAMRRSIEGALEGTGGSLGRTAAALGIHRTYLADVMKRLKIDRKSYVPRKMTP